MSPRRVANGAAQRGETRAVEGATLPTSWSASTSWVGGSSAFMPSTAEAIDMMAAGYDVSWLVNRCINIIADTVSGLPFRAGPSTDTPGDIRPAAPLAYLLGPPPGNPNREMSARALLKWSVINYLVAGRFAWEIERRGGRTDLTSPPLAVWPLQTRALTPITDPGTKDKAPGRYFKGFRYAVNRAEPIDYDRARVVYAWNMNGSDPSQPQSALQSLRLNVNLLVTYDKFSYGFLMNDARPSTMVTHGVFADPEAKANFYRSYLNNHRGPENAGKTTFAEVDLDDSGNAAGVLDVKVIGVTPKDAQQVEAYRQQIAAICGGLGVPYGLLDSSGRTFSNADAEIENFFAFTMKPLLADLQDHINRDLAVALGPEVGWFDLSGIPALRPRLAEGVGLKDVLAVLTRDEIRSYAGVPPLTPEQAAELDDQAAASAAAALALATAQQAPAADPAASDPAADAPTDAPAPEPVRSVPAPREPDRRAAAIAALTPLIRRQLALLDARSLRSAIVRAEGKRGRQALGEASIEHRVLALYDAQASALDAQDALAPVYDAALAAASAAVGAAVPDDDQARAWVDGVAARHARSLAAVRSEALAAALAGDLTEPAHLTAAVQAGHQRDASVAAPVAGLVYDAAERFVRSVSAAGMRALLVGLTTGEIDLDSALERL